MCGPVPARIRSWTPLVLVVSESGIARDRDQVDPAYTSQTCPACFARNTAADWRYVCVDCGWMGHRDAVGAINIARDTGRRGDSAGAAVASGADGGWAA